MRSTTLKTQKNAPANKSKSKSKSPVLKTRKASTSAGRSRSNRRNDVSPGKGGYDQANILINVGRNMNAGALNNQINMFSTMPNPTSSSSSVKNPPLTMRKVEDQLLRER